MSGNWRSHPTDTAVMTFPALKAEVVGLSEFRTRAAEWMAKAAATQAPIFITQRGRAEAVLLTPQAYDRLVDLAASAPTATGPAIANDEPDEVPEEWADLPEGTRADAMAVLEALRSNGQSDVDHIVDVTGLTVQRVLVAITTLEIAGLARHSMAGVKLESRKPRRDRR